MPHGSKFTRPSTCDAVVSGNMFKRIDGIIGLRHLVNIAIMTVTYKLPRSPVLGTGIFASIYKSGATQHQDY